MALCKMVKVIIAGHKKEADAFVESIQREAILHLAEFSESSKNIISQQKTYKSEDSEIEKHLLQNLHEARIFLEQFKPKVSLIESLITPPQTLKLSEFNDLFRKSHPKTILKRVDEIRNRISELNTEKNSVYELREHLKNFKNIDILMEDCGEKNSSEINLAMIDTEKLKTIIPADDIDIEILEERGKQTIILAAAHRSNRPDSKDFFIKNKIVLLDPPIAKGSPKNAYENTAIDIEKINNELKNLKNESQNLLSQLIQLEVIIQNFNSMERKSELFRKWLSTENAFIISGWIKKKDYNRLESLSSGFDSISLEAVEDAKESPPVAFEENRLFSPFQLITKLYSMPNYKSIDPSPVTSIFFIVFFGLCLTDAGYGLILALASLYGIRKFKSGKDLLWILFWGGILTVAAGLLTGGIFGDLFRQEEPFLNAPILSSIRDSLTWFDPMKEPMVFFRLVLLLGVIHVAAGLIMGAASNVKQKLFLDALVENFSWLTIIISLLAILFSSDMCVKMSLVTSESPPFPAVIQQPAILALCIMGAVVVLFGARNEKSLFFRFFIGFLKLVILSGVFSYLGDILSYIRLMALGMVTAGIAMAVNTIAFMLYDIPFAGAVLTAAVLIVGHLFNMAINLLGAFVHTLRLQYVEFYSKFFIGGGKEFSPLSFDETYFKIIV